MSATQAIAGTIKCMNEWNVDILSGGLVIIAKATPDIAAQLAKLTPQDYVLFVGRNDMENHYFNISGFTILPPRTSAK
jgi:hypothetical protein